MLLFPFQDLLSEGCNSGHATGGWGQDAVSHSGDGVLLTIATFFTCFSTLDPGLSFSIYLPLRLDCCLCPFCLPTEVAPQPFPAITWVVTTASCRLHLLLLSVSFPPPCLPCSPRYAHLQMPQCVDLLHVFVCWAGNPLLNYRYLTWCNFKERNLEVFSWQHDADITWYNTNDNGKR